MGLLTKKSPKDIPKQVGKKIMNKFGRGTTFARLMQATWPMGYGMKATRHRKLKSYLSKGYI